MPRPALTKDLEITLQLAVLEATRRKHEYAGLEHLLFALLHDAPTVAALGQCGVSIDSLRDDLDAYLREEEENIATEGEAAGATLTFGFRGAVQRAALQVAHAGRSQVTGMHVIAALFQESDSHAVYLLERQGLTRLRVIQHMSHAPRAATAPPAFIAHPAGEREEPGERRQESEEASPANRGDALSRFTVLLNDGAAEGRFDPLIGRQTELDRLVRILSRRTKNNPLLVGDPGVGKTALVEGFASRVVAGEIPSALRDVEVFALDLGALLAGTRFRGDFEERLRATVAELKERPHAVLFIDEIHTLVGAGATGGGTVDASNLLKPALTRGEIRCIGSTTWEEFRSHFEKDRALARRFQKIEVNEPTAEETLAILQGVQPRFEEFHGVRYTAGALEVAVALSARYLHDRRLPDKAVDLLDEAGATAKLAAPPGGVTPAVVDTDAIERALAAAAGIPAPTAKSSDIERLRSLEPELKERVFGQDAAVGQLAAAVRLSRAGLRDAEKPVGSYLFTGPTGVGKTEVARSLAAILGVELIRFDMSEYGERHTVSRLIGAPPGYVGFDQAGLLTEAVTRSPHSVLLLDEIEKAHPDIFNLLLQVMDYGRLTDHNGKRADFRNVILIMTSNVGAREMARGHAGFSDSARGGEDERAFRDTFTPEFRNRLDARIPFAALSHEAMRRIVGRMLGELGDQLRERAVDLAYSDAVVDHLARRGFDPAQGARPLARLIQEEIKRPLGEELLFGDLAGGGKATLAVDEGDLRLDTQAPA